MCNQKTQVKDETALIFTMLSIMEGLPFAQNSICSCNKPNCIYCSPENYGITKKMRYRDEMILAELMTQTSRNTLENLHAGTFPQSKIGDYSDVKVVTPYEEIPWNELSRISDVEMGPLKDDMRKEIILALRIYTTLKSKLQQIKLEPKQNK